MEGEDKGEQAVEVLQGGEDGGSGVSKGVGTFGLILPFIPPSFFLLLTGC